MLATILKTILLFFACGVAMVLCVRLQQMQKRLADLHDELRANDQKMAEHRRDLEVESARQDVEKAREE